MEPLFKVGDVVRIKERIGNGGDYKYSFVDEMANLSGKEFTIKEIIPDDYNGKCTIPDDNARYSLYGNWHAWSSGMLELVSREEESTRYQSKPDNEPLKITISKKNKLKLNFKL